MRKTVMDQVEARMVETGDWIDRLRKCFSVLIASRTGENDTCTVGKSNVHYSVRFSDRFELAGLMSIGLGQLGRPIIHSRSHVSFTIVKVDQ
ncbi:unnamed protein product [Linum trigynum]|uniref:Uncharacterized protein n=1 Tax=Linum trigynum TaxID=586398 RepID=A0AAV2FEE6_9ROSI